PVVIIPSKAPVTPTGLRSSCCCCAETPGPNNTPSVSTIANPIALGFVELTDFIRFRFGFRGMGQTQLEPSLARRELSAWCWEKGPAGFSPGQKKGVAELRLGRKSLLWQPLLSQK